MLTLFPSRSGSPVGSYGDLNGSYGYLNLASDRTHPNALKSLLEAVVEQRCVPVVLRAPLEFPSLRPLQCLYNCIYCWLYGINARSLQKLTEPETFRSIMLAIINAEPDRMNRYTTYNNNCLQALWRGATTSIRHGKVFGIPEGEHYGWDCQERAETTYYKMLVEPGSVSFTQMNTQWYGDERRLQCELSVSLAMLQTACFEAYVNSYQRENREPDLGPIEEPGKIDLAGRDIDPSVLDAIRRHRYIQITPVELLTDIFVE